MMKNPNFLVLDETTNDLDIATLQVLEEYLMDFKGCVIIVSHDRYFMDKVVDHLLVFRGAGLVKDFPGNYTQYRAWEDEHLEEENSNNSKAAKPVLERVSVHKRKLSFKEKKELEELEIKIEELEKEKVNIEDSLCSGTLSVEELTEKSKRLPIVIELLDDASMRWLELSEIEE